MIARIAQTVTMPFRVIGLRTESAGEGRPEFALALAALFLLLADPGYTQIAQHKLSNPDWGSVAFGPPLGIGASAALEGATLVLGAPRGYGGTPQRGLAEVWRCSTAGAWQFQAVLIPSDIAAIGEFGFSVDVSGDTVIVGRPCDDAGGTDSGAAYIFVRSGTDWVQQAKIVASDLAPGDKFGGCVAILGNTAIVGAAEDDDLGDCSGSAYVFTRSGGVWTQHMKLTPSDGGIGNRFGCALALCDDTAVVGAYGSRAAYVFTRSGDVWSERQKLTASDPGGGLNFGVSVAMTTDTLLVGDRYAYAVGDFEHYVGAAYVFTRSGDVWTEQQRIAASDAADGDLFGASVGVSGDTAIVGAYGDDDVVSGSGSAYVFVRSGGVWSQQQKLTLPAGAAYGNDHYGSSVDVSGDIAICGAPDGGGPFMYPGAAYAYSRSAGSWTRKQSFSGLRSYDFAANDAFGFSVAKSGNTVAVGVRFDGSMNSGAAYVYARSGEEWLSQQRLAPSDPGVNDYFGHAVGLSGDTLVVGASGKDADPNWNAGAVYAFVRSSGVWTQQAQLVASDAAPDDRFGDAVAISGDTAVVGVYGDDDAGSETGSAYVFVRSGGTWTQQAKLTASDAIAGLRFGDSVAIEADTIVIGASGNDAAAIPGAAYVFTRSGGVWTQRAKLLASDGAALDYFGKSVWLSGNTALVGASGDDDGGPGSGSVYVFTGSGGAWTQQQKLTASDAAAGDSFGYTVTLLDNMAVVGAYRDDDAGADSGSAYVFVRRSGVWTQDAKIVASDAAAGDNFGLAVALDYEAVVCGAPYNDDPETDAGSAYVFDLASLDVYVVTVSTATDDGSVILSPNLPYYEYGSTVSLTAVPDPDCRFAFWSGRGVPAGRERDNPLVLTIGVDLYPLAAPAPEADGTSSEPRKRVVVNQAKDKARGSSAGFPKLASAMSALEIVANFEEISPAAARAESWATLE